MNLYRYVGNEATGAIDPAGLEEEGQAFEGELWTFSGISNWDEERKKYVDYVGKLLASAGIGIKKSDQPFMSKLGIGPHYRGSKDVYSYVSSEYRLDFEARSMMKDVDIEKIKSDKPRIDIYLVAPKTDTCVTPESLREKGFDVRITILWSPWDDVPNQSLGELPGRSYWEKLGDDVYTVIPYLNYGVSYSQHEFLAYLEGPLRSAYLHRYLVPRTMQKGVVRATWKLAPDEPWVNSPGLLDLLSESRDADYIWVGHSQGCNMIEYLLHRIYLR